MIAGIGIGALVIGIVIFAAKLIAGSPETFEGRSIDNIHPEMNNGGVYEFTIPDGLESPENAESRLLQSGSGDVATTESTITISTDYTGWITGVPDTLNPTETQSYGAEVTLTAADLGEAMAASMDGATEGSIYLVAAPEGYFLNRAPQLEVESSYAQLVVVLIVDVS